MTFKVGVGTAIRAAYTDNGVPYMWESGDVTTIPSNEFKIKASDAADDDYFGNSVAVGSGRIVVGAYADDDNGAGSGSAYIYNINAGIGTTENKKILASDGAGGDNFGWSVAVGSGRIVVGAYGDDYNGNLTGSAYIFDLNGNQLGIITASDGTAGDYFGWSVAVGSGKIVVGAFFDDDNGNASGSAYIYDLDGTNEVKIRASDGAASDFFGFSVAVGSGKIVVGSYGDDDNGSVSGSAYIYDLDGTNEVKITASDNFAGDQFGRSVAVGSGRIVVGAPFDNDNGSDSGSAYIYNLDGTNEVKITASDGSADDKFGWPVAVGSGRIVVGCSGDVNSNKGAAYIYDLDGNQLEIITASNGASGDNFGYSVAAGSGKIVVGARLDNIGFNNQGSAYIYDTPQVYTLYDAIDLQYG